jgi:hypothetical protein
MIAVVNAIRTRLVVDKWSKLEDLFNFSDANSCGCHHNPDCGRHPQFVARPCPGARVRRITPSDDAAQHHEVIRGYQVAH